MSNKTNKPKLTTSQLITKMKEKGITFNYVKPEIAELYLANVNNYMRTASYRKNYNKYTNGKNKGKYIDLDFAYLQELSTIDMHLRFLISKMCLDIEHDLKVKMLLDMEKDNSTDGYDVVFNFLNQNSYIINKLQAASSSPFVSDLINKYFQVQTIENSLGRYEKKIISYDDCPAWVLLEMLTFGDFIKFYEFYYSTSASRSISTSIINLVKSLRNGAAHNNCIIYNLEHSTSKAPREISKEISHIKTIGKDQRKKKLSCRPMLEFVALLYLYSLIVSEKVKYHRIEELRTLFFHRMLCKQDFFKNNDLIRSNYEFACKVINYFFNMY